MGNSKIQAKSCILFDLLNTGKPLFDLLNARFFFFLTRYCSLNFHIASVSSGFKDTFCPEICKTSAKSLALALCATDQEVDVCVLAAGV